MVVGIGPTEAKVEAVMNDFCQISRKRNVFEKMKGVVTEGIMDESYTYTEVDVNRRTDTNETGAKPEPDKKSNGPKRKRSKR